VDEKVKGRMLRPALAHPYATAQQPGGKEEKVECFELLSIILLLQFSNLAEKAGELKS